MNSPYGTSPKTSAGTGLVCTCCQRPWYICVRDTRRGDESRQRTCPRCHEHGPSSMERDRVHVDLWRSLSEAQVRTHQAEAARLRGQIAQLEQELADRPVREVERYVGADEIQAHKDEADRAFRSRENAWQALCEIRLLHREGEPGRCRCRKRLDQCPIAEIVDRYPGLGEWEEEQIRRLRSHDRRGHKLPDRHPAVLDPHWQP